MVIHATSSRLGKRQGFVLVTVLTLMVIFTGASIAGLYTVTASIKSTGHMRERLQRFYQADGGWQAVFGYMCDRAITQASNTPLSEYRNTALLYSVSIRDARTVKRRLPGYSGELLGRDIFMESAEKAAAGASPIAGNEVLVFIGQTHLSGGYGNE